MTLPSNRQVLIPRVGAVIWTTTLLFVAMTQILVWLEPHGAILESALSGVVLLIFSSVGLIIVQRLPQNRVGWVFSVGTVLWAGGGFLLEYAGLARSAGHHALQGALASAMAGGSARAVGWTVMIMFLPLLFPTGRLPSGRWQPVAWLIALLLLLQILAGVVAPNPMDDRFAAIHNPVAIAAASHLVDLTIFVSLGLVIVCAAAIAVRYGRSTGIERQQIKWFGVGAAIPIVTVALAFFFPLPSVAWEESIAAIPIATVIAILRYRLYDLDVLINRTLVYGSLTLSLGAVYIGGVVGLQALARAVTGQSSDITVAVATLAVAALFNPWRRRLQRFIDRRFYRRKYDAARILAGFSTQLRDEVELDLLAHDLAAVLTETVQPASLALWLRPERQNA
jgi:hypothetical protein